MPWMECGPMDQREKFVLAALSKQAPMAWLCDEFGIARKTGYKWLKRYHAAGQPGLTDAPRVAKTFPHRTPDAIEKKIIEYREGRPYRGPKKLLWDLQRDPAVRKDDLPCASTIANVLKRNGLCETTRRRRHWASRPERPPIVTEPNALWRADHKGDFVMNNSKVMPLTVTDAATRKVLLVEPAESTSIADAKMRLTRIFQECGLPLAFQSDNGTPFGSAGLGGLTKLSVWLIRLGIVLYRSRPGRPTDNAEHERMHGAMVKEALRNAQFEPDPVAHLRIWQAYYNGERPHEALGMRTPNELWQPSPREMPRVLAELEYPSWYEVRRVRGDGSIKLRGGFVYLSEALVGERVGLEMVDDSIYAVQIGPLTLATINRENRLLSRLVRPDRPAREAILPHGEGLPLP
jgi:putative transposase